MKPKAERSKLLTVDEAADYLGVRPATIRSWILNRQKIDVVRIGRLVRITEKSIERFIEENTFSPKNSR